MHKRTTPKTFSRAKELIIELDGPPSGRSIWNSKNMMMREQVSGSAG